MPVKNLIIASVQAYLNKSHDYLTQAEALLNQKTDRDGEIINYCQKAILLLLQAYLLFKGEKSEERVSIDQLFSRCASLEEDFYSLEETIAYLTVEENSDDLDKEELAEKVDAANEVWDFVLSFLPERYHL